MEAFLAQIRQRLVATGRPDLILAVFAGTLAWFGMLITRAIVGG